MDEKNKLITEFASSLSNTIGADSLRIAVNHLTLVLSEFDVSAKSTELAPVDTESEKLLKRFLATKKVEGRSEKTLERYQYIIARLYKEMMVPFTEMNVYTLRFYLAQLEQNGCNENTVNGIRSIFCSFFGWLHDEGVIDKNPTSNLGIVKCKKVVRKPFTNVELELIKANCPSARDRAIVELLLATGCRIEEATSLNIADLNFSSQECKVLGKGNKERIVFLNDVCCLHVQKYLLERSDCNEALFVW